MASAILPRRNDPRSSDFIGKFTENSHLNFTRFQNIPNSNPNPNFSNCFIGNNGRDIVWKNHQPPTSSTSPQAGFIGSSIKSVQANSNGYRYTTFRLDSYTRRELKLLKKRLMSDLERVRILRQLVCSTPMPKKNHHAPQLELPTASEAHLMVKEREKGAIGPKRAKNLPPVRDTKKQCGRLTIAQRRKMMMRECGQILGKLMKHKHGWVFNTPVDAAAMKLYDYHNVINNPMDLGTIKSKLAKNAYVSPLAFASDVRLTFENAMLYNGRGSDVFAMAERLLVQFEDMFHSTHMKFLANQVKKPVPNATIIVEAEAPVVVQSQAANLIKPMIRVQNKPEMSADEKAELAASFLSLQLGPEGINQIMTIVKKSAGFEHEGDEIELDLAVLDNDTLWELHRFIGQSLEKQAVATDIASSSPACEEHLVEEHARKRDVGEEDVDIGDEMQLTDYPLIEIDKDVVNGGSISISSDSSSDSDSSSSDSGSGNSCNEQEVNSTPNRVVVS